MSVSPKWWVYHPSEECITQVMSVSLNKSMAIDFKIRKIKDNKEVCAQEKDIKATWS